MGPEELRWKKGQEDEPAGTRGIQDPYEPAQHQQGDDSRRRNEDGGKKPGRKKKGEKNRRTASPPAAGGKKEGVGKDEEFGH